MSIKLYISSKIFGVMGSTWNGVLANFRLIDCIIVVTWNSSSMKGKLSALWRNLMEEYTFLRWSYDAVIEYSSKKATRVSLSAGRIFLLK